MRAAAGFAHRELESLGAVGIMEARRRRQRFAVDLQATAPATLGARATLADVAAEWLREQRVRLEVGETSVRTFEIYEVGLRRHVLPALGSRQVRAITPDELVVWIRRMRTRYSPHTVHDYWGALHLVLGFAVGRGLIAGNPAASLTSSERPKPGASPSPVSLAPRDRAAARRGAGALPRGRHVRAVLRAATVRAARAHMG